MHPHQQPASYELRPLLEGWRRWLDVTDPRFLILPLGLLAAGDATQWPDCGVDDGPTAPLVDD